MKMRTVLLTSILILVMLFAAGQSIAQPVQTKKYVIFRDDDVGLKGSLETLKTVNQVHIDENVPVTLAIVPHPDLNGSGNELLTEPLHSYLQSIKGDPLFEFAQHGYTHQNNSLSSGSSISEFAKGPTEVQYDALRALGVTEYCTGGTEFPNVKERIYGIKVEKASIDLDISGSYDALNKSVE